MKRYLCDVNDLEIFIDTENNDQMLNTLEVNDILNKQDERIKELEEQLKFARMSEKFEQEKKTNALKYQNNKAIEVLERLRTEFCQPYSDDIYSAGQIAEKIDNQIAELRGK